jgi:hypothetical protein
MILPQLGSVMSVMVLDHARARRNQQVRRNTLTGSKFPDRRQAESPPVVVCT